MNLNLIQIAEENKRYYTKEFLHGFQTGAKNQYDADVKAMPKWTPVKEKLPEYEENVLLQLKDGGIRAGWLRLVEAKYPMWCCIEELPIYLMKCEAIAWMSLPEPYKMDEVEE